MGKFSANYASYCKFDYRKTRQLKGTKVEHKESQMLQNINSFNSISMNDSFMNETNAANNTLDKNKNFANNCIRAKIEHNQGTVGKCHFASLKYDSPINKFQKSAK